MKLIFQYLRRHIYIFLISTLFLTLEAVADLLQPTFMSYIVDKGVENADIRKILSYGAVMLCIVLLGAVSAVMRNIFASRTSQAIGKELRRDMYHRVQTLSLENIDRLQPASVITRITNDVAQIQEFINGMMRIMAKAPITCVGAIVLIIVQTPRQAPIMIAIIMVVAALIFGNVKIGYPRFAKVQNKLDKLNGVAREFLTSVRVVKAFNAEREEAKKFNMASNELATASTEALQVMSVFFPLINLSVNFGIVILLWISKSQDVSQIGKLMASINYMTQVLFSVTIISNVINVAVRAIASSRRIQEVLDEKPAQVVPDRPQRPEILGDICFEHVSFAYANAGKDALHNIDFHIKSGETIGIIGPTGSGKTTLINLILGFYDAQEGKVLIDGCDVKQIDKKWLRSAVAIAPQKALLFSGTIRENLLWGDSKADDEALQKAAEIACADFIQKTERGYDTVLGQGGVNLSGGQKQRLSLARALVRNPKILILDDCTSALDAETEAAVLRGLRSLSGSMTILLISQRISTVRKADRILCLEQGEMKGFGTHEELLASCPLYRDIYDSQIGGDSHGR
ncbi:ABC transporter [Clostridium thermosuccinogenes]|uniref:ABC transporter n=1 Tax=Clostridium thermosuccinogenes TaxID=84032 RepID=A0A2K2FJ39_9CLOT|nr:ABC transporter ATP-binding protein [Pseudoclostridium thermosuccinogenes]AUS97563.1 ABC transporter [Pseudoclostridium thermosuccinogenes]PNT96914.1 ABC transporter [Pseudoclostridium thermosuccinogenes]PNT98797.1 ABC transporter [Pseudoclostridium thermosuccinogenes]